MTTQIIDNPTIDQLGRGDVVTLSHELVTGQFGLPFNGTNLEIPGLGSYSPTVLTRAGYKLVSLSRTNTDELELTGTLDYGNLTVTLGGKELFSGSVAGTGTKTVIIKKSDFGE